MSHRAASTAIAYLGETPHGYHLLRVESDPPVWIAGCRGPWTRAQCEAHWGSAVYSDRIRGAKILAMLDTAGSDARTDADAVVRDHAAWADREAGRDVAWARTDSDADVRWQAALVDGQAG